MRKILVLAAAGAALAIGVPKAFAVGDTPSSNNAPVQNAQPDQQRPDRDDCPEKHGRGGGEQSSSSSTAEI